MIQCRMDRVMNNCGCISYYFPCEESDICPIEQFPCSYKNRQVGKIFIPFRFIYKTETSEIGSALIKDI